MNVLVKTALVIVILLAQTGGLAQSRKGRPLRGGVDGAGGGDIPQSTAQQVRNAVQRIPDGLRNIFYNLGLGLNQVENPYIHRILKTMYTEPIGGSRWEKNQPIWQDIKTTKLEIVDGDQGCLDAAGESHPASTRKGQIGAPICLSLRFLRLIPPSDLESHILALVAHELAHHFGFGEFESKKFQIFILHNIRNLTAPEKIMLRLKNIHLPGYKGDRYEVQYFQNGKIIREDKLKKNEPYCSLTIFLTYKDEGNFFKSGTYPELDIAAQTIELKAVTSWNGHQEDGEWGWGGVTYHINNYWNETNYEPMGFILRSPKNKEPVTPTRAKKLHCGNQIFRMMDIKQAFGDLADEPNLDLKD